MLCQLSIQNIALIENMSVDFGKGFNVITGETGSGKSTVVDAINLVLGERADKELIRNGCDKASVEAVFDIKNNGKILELIEKYGLIEDQDNLILSRVISASGKSICRVNSQIVTLSILKEISKYLVDVHGQHQHQSLLNVENHQAFIDNFGNSELLPILNNVGLLYKKFKSTDSQIKSFRMDKQERERRIDILNFQINEIEKAKLAVNEDVELAEQHDILVNSQKIMDTLENSYSTLYNGANDKNSVLDDLSNIISQFNDISGYDKYFEDICTKFNDIYYNLQDIAFSIRDRKDNYDFDPNRLNDIDERIELINTLKRKYGYNITSIIDFLNKSKCELSELENNQITIKNLQSDYDDLKAELFSESAKLSNIRYKISKDLEKKVTDQLKDLGMNKSIFSIEIKSPDLKCYIKDYEYPFTEKGMDNIEFMISTNPGEPLRPLVKIVSGGELSRIMLALKSVSANTDDIPCLVFDEIDTGISGHIAEVVGEKLINISKDHQIICITHLPQIASFADSHYAVTKITNSTSSRTFIQKLNIQQRYEEIAKIITGSTISQLSIKHAKEIIEQAQKFKMSIHK